MGAPERISSPALTNEVIASSSTTIRADIGNGANGERLGASLVATEGEKAEDEAWNEDTETEPTEERRKPQSVFEGLVLVDADDKKLGKRGRKHGGNCQGEEARTGEKQDCVDTCCRWRATAQQYANQNRDVVDADGGDEHREQELQRPIVQDGREDTLGGLIDGFVHRIRAEAPND